MHIEKDMLMRDKQMILPNALRYEAVQAYHRQIGHAGSTRTIASITQRYVWSGMQSYVGDFCSHCNVCLKNKPSRRTKEPLQPYTLDELRPRNIVAFAVAVLPWVTHQHRYFLLIVDLFSKFVEIIFNHTLCGNRE